MSFLGNIVDSIGGDRVPPPPPKPPSRPNSANTARPINNNGKNATRPGSHPTPSASTGMKRKAEDDPSMASAKASKPTTLTETTARRVAAPPLHAPKPQHSKGPAAPNVETDKGAVSQISKPTPATVTAATTTKPAPKGSYAEMMARAKQSAEQRVLSQVGTIKHQETKKDKMSRIAEKRKMEQDKAKASKPGTPAGVKKDARRDVRRSASPVKKDISHPGKPSTVPLKATYKGTMGMAASRSRSQNNGRPGARKPRYDEYLGTDEEDNSDLLDREEDGYGSDASSDMEAGFDDMELEDTKALRAAKDDDAQEIALENKLKREKEERRKKLLGLAKKQR